MSESETVGGQDDDEILGFPGDGFKDANLAEVRDPSEDTGDSEMNEVEGVSGQDSTKKRKTNSPVPPDEFVTDRIKVLTDKIGGTNREENQWTLLLREQFCDQTIY